MYRQLTVSLVVSFQLDFTIACTELVRLVVRILGERCLFVCAQNLS